MLRTSSATRTGHGSRKCAAQDPSSAHSEHSQSTAARPGTPQGPTQTKPKLWGTTAETSFLHSHSSSPRPIPEPFCICLNRGFPASSNHFIATRRIIQCTEENNRSNRTDDPLPADHQINQAFPLIISRGTNEPFGPLSQAGGSTRLLFGSHQNRLSAL